MNSHIRQLLNQTENELFLLEEQHRYALLANIENAKHIITDLLRNPFPWDLIQVRRVVKLDYAGDEVLAKEQMESYCTERFLTEAMDRHHTAKRFAEEFLKANETPTI